MLEVLIKQNSQLEKYKIITDLDKSFEEYDIMKNKLKKLINKYTNKKEVEEEIISLIYIRGIDGYTLSLSLHANKIDLPENKEERMLKDLTNCQKNVGIWSLNGFTMNEIVDLII